MTPQGTLRGGKKKILPGGGELRYNFLLAVFGGQKFVDFC